MSNKLEQTQIPAFSQAQDLEPAAESFGCCSRYRACSDAKACLIPDLDYSRGCIYRKNLESGNIFYGKNAIAYRPEVYEDFKKKYDMLSEEEKEALHEVFHYFFIEKTGRYRAMFPENPIFSSLETASFIHLASHPSKIVNKCTIDAMINACGSRIFEANQWAENNCPPEQWAKRKRRRKDLDVKIYRTELVEWILKFSPETCTELSKGICFVEIDVEAMRELYELFKDCMYQVNYVPTLSTCESDPRFLASV